MLLIDRQRINQVRSAERVADVRDALQGAVERELATLPPYLTAVFSVKPRQNDAARSLVLSVAIEEMLHMGLAANTLIAIGGRPAVRGPGLELRYPGKLPMSVDPALVVSLGSLTPERARDVFMAIERPDTDALLPGEVELPMAVQLHRQKEYESIGDFYEAIIGSLTRLQASGAEPFAEPQLQLQVDLCRWFSGDLASPPRAGAADAVHPTAGKVWDLPSARLALETIIRQGEGAKVGADPIDPYAGKPGELAHYFKFGEVAHGRRLVRDPRAPSGWSYTGEPVPFDPKGVFPFPENAALSSYAPGSAAAINGQQFYAAYVRLLTALDQAFNGEPQQLNAAIGIMYELKLVAQRVVQSPADATEPDGLQAAPPFQPTPGSVPSRDRG